MENKFAIFKRFQNLSEAKELVELLNSNNISTELGDNSPTFDITLTGNEQTKYEVRIKQNDFEAAEKIFEQKAETDIKNIDDSYFIFSLTNEELYDIISKSDEWGPLNSSLAKQVLIKRGKNIDENTINSLKKKRLDELAKPEKNQQTWIIAGYFFALIGGLIGIVIGYTYLTTTKTIPNGQKVYTYSKNDRKHGKNIIILGTITLVIGIIFKIIK